MIKTATQKKDKTKILMKGQKYCKMLHLEHSAILLTCIKLPFVIKTYFWSSFVWPLMTGFTVTVFKIFSLGGILLEI